MYLFSNSSYTSSYQAAALEWRQRAITHFGYSQHTHIFESSSSERENDEKFIRDKKKEDKGKRKICDERNWNILISQTFNKQSKWSKKVAVEEEEVGMISRCIVIESTNAM